MVHVLSREALSSRFVVVYREGLLSSSGRLDMGKIDFSVPWRRPLNSVTSRDLTMRLSKKFTRVSQSSQS